MRDVIIIGSGPAGFTAAIYAARANLSPLLIASSVEVGGELMQTTEVENFPGFPEGIMGPDLMDRMQKQAEKFGTEIVYDDVTALDIAGQVKSVTTGEGQTYQARTLIYATGSAYRKLGCERETELSGRGISWCATCDGAFFRNRHVAVIGGGDSAMEEATFLSRFASQVTVIHRRDALRASAAMVERAKADPKIDFRWNSTVSAFQGDQKVTGLVLRDTVTGAETPMPVDGVFEAIGSDPRTHLVHGLLDLTDAGTIAVQGRSSRTSVPGVFAAGDVVDPTYKQAATAAGSGVVAALDAQAYLADLDDKAPAQIQDRPQVGDAAGNTATSRTVETEDVETADRAGAHA
ncbi:thioredoxin-disulfide reductase [Acidipropionibacterium jensenii]|uniref:Thioredoxin reductase n=1 Tax=Acidipropionibacterium jensenii TaxID=1749 RepID=A0A3Q9ULP7_9ACTN|nr:thioredoxin-disulfide reductase [Acidipropionibacterium jensenii]AZZ40319.1 thioredoxin-disulfide reductase [Acidipropionibacterium jensenii]